MKCPYCENEMEQGYIESARDIFWSKEKHKIFFNAKKNEILIVSGLNGSIKKAVCCTFCKKIVVVYND